MLYSFAKALVLPPGILLLLVVVGLVCLRRRFDWAWWVGAVAAILLVGSSLPMLGTGLLSRLEVYPPLPVDKLTPGEADAIVVLAAEDDLAAEYGRSVAGAMTLVRVHYGAWLARRTGLPVLVTGGVSADPARSIADAMADVLREGGGVGDIWIEGRAANTWENARFSAELLAAKGINRVYLVTHAWHMPRAVSAFRQAGLAVVAAPTAFRGPVSGFPASLIPSAKTMLDVYYAAHEFLGKLVYDRPWLRAVGVWGS